MVILNTLSRMGVKFPVGADILFSTIWASNDRAVELSCSLIKPLMQSYDMSDMCMLIRNDCTCLMNMR